jgi:hypothetical protein
MRPPRNSPLPVDSAGFSSVTGTPAMRQENTDVSTLVSWAGGRGGGGVAGRRAGVSAGAAGGGPRAPRGWKRLRKRPAGASKPARPVVGPQAPSPAPLLQPPTCIWPSHE